MRLESLWSLIKIKWPWFSCSLKIHVYCVNPVFIILMHFSKQYENHEHWIFKIPYRNFWNNMRTMIRWFSKPTKDFKTAWEPWSLDFQSIQRFWKVYENHEHCTFKVPCNNFQNSMRSMITCIHGILIIWKVYETYEHWIDTGYKNFHNYMRTMITWF